MAIMNSAGKPLQGTLYKGRSSKSLLLVCHGYRSSRRHPALVAIVDGLNQKGYTTFTFNFSVGSELDLQRQADDIQDIVDHFEIYDEIILLAGSFGALVCTMAIRKPSRVKGLVTVNGFFGSAKLGRKYRQTYKTYKLFSLLSPRHRKLWHDYKTGFKPQDISIPVLAIHSKSDEVVSYEQSEDFIQKVTGPHELELLDEIDHHITSPKAVRKVVSLIDTWLKKHRTK